MQYKERLFFAFLFLCFYFFQSGFAQSDLKYDWGGALRFNYNFSDWKKDSKNKGGDFGFDVFRLNVKGAYRKISVDAEYRFYADSSGGPMLKHGWFGYQFDTNHQLQVGLTQVPFGLLPVTSNNFFFNINYYLGLEDNYDMGIKYVYQKAGWQLYAAFFKNADVLDFGDKSEISPDRYAYDIAGRNKQVNQGNVQFNYNWRGSLTHQVGLSGLVGGIYNIDTHKTGLRKALALHYWLNYGNWDVKAQWTAYSMNAKNGEDEMGEQESKRVVTLGAYGGTYEVAAKGITYQFGLAYTLPIKKGIIDDIRFYNDFSMLHKTERVFKDSYQNVLGLLITAGPVFTYIDYAIGKNHAWFGNAWTSSFAQGDPAHKWNGRLNINMGYYF